MSTREDVERGVLVYTCNCGWLDTGHADSRSRRPHVGAASLWRQITTESGLASRRPGASGFKVTYTQDMRWRGLTAAETRIYFVRRGLSPAQKESVALSIFMEVSYAFEEMQGSFPFSLTRANDSSFSEEDLVSDLIGFYVAVRPGIRPLDLCRGVSRRASLAVWDTYGSVGSHKNRSFSPVFHPCDECRGPSRFPPTFQQIVPAAKGDLFRDWIVRPTIGLSDDEADELFVPVMRPI
ncbi:hypothetical protein WMF45_23135 [Sorangium sp. So ce448]|uniref:hypothetical protein n=1 Tax=Sorangium sp. So ce448 TaxID=3133314 RepID=UPI003F63C387